MLMTAPLGNGIREQSADYCECGISAEIEELETQVLDMAQYKSLLKEAIAGCTTCLSTNMK